VRAVAVLVAIGCGGGGGGAPAPAAPGAPWRAATAAEPLLGRLPAGADLLVEIDLARLRANPVVGSLATRVFSDAPAVVRIAGVDVAVEPGVGARADVLVLASYAVGTPEARSVVLAVIGDEIVEVTDPVDVGASVADDADLLEIRARAMPTAADGAIARIAARLDPDARRGLAAELGVDLAPAELSMWADVADDLAVIAVIDSPGAGDAAAAELRRWLDDLAEVDAVRLLGLTPAVRDARIAPHADGLRAIGLVGPRRLARAVGRARTFLDTP
jgi:hypothetical protein